MSRPDGKFELRASRTKLETDLGVPPGPKRPEGKPLPPTLPVPELAAVFLKEIRGNKDY